MQPEQVQKVLSDFVEIRLNDEDGFLKIRETLTRMGVASKNQKILYQSCHILHKQDRYYVVHFKELFKLDGRNTDISQEDIARRNTIVSLLEQWGLVTLVDPSKVVEPKLPIEKLKILPFSEKLKWELQPKYKIGKFKQKSS
jgi:hypothetical protein